MKLAEALVLRSDMQKKLASLKERIGRNSVVQQGDKPHEDPAQLLKEAVGVLKQLEALVVRIHKANLQTKLSDGRSLSEVIAARDTLVQHHSLLQHAITNATREPDRYSMKEIKWVAVQKVSSLQKQADDVSKKIRDVNMVMQKANWEVELK
jgi:hypothetical protein